MGRVLLAFPVETSPAVFVVQALSRRQQAAKKACLAEGVLVGFFPPWKSVDPAQAYCWCFIKRVDLGDVVFAMQCRAWKPWFPAFIYVPNCCYGNSIFKEVIIADLVACVHF